MRLGKQQYDNHKYGLALATFREVLAIDPGYQPAQRAIQVCREARQQQSEQVLQNDQLGNQPQNLPRWRRRQQN